MSDIKDGPTATASSHGHQSQRRLHSGIAGLDDILHGGLPKGHIYLLEGDPGTGKTTLAMQFLLAGAAAGESTLYITLSESREELEATGREHGWPVERLRIAEAIPPEDDLKPEAQYTVFHPSEVELADTISTIFKQVDDARPKRLVFDSLSELRMLARDPLRYRRQILALKRHLSGADCTVLLVDDRTGQGDNLQLQSIAHGVLQLENLDRTYGVNRRRIQVRKLRGSSFREGYHDYTIVKGGLSIYPRLIASEHTPGFERKHVPSGIQELDDLFGGGIDTGTSTLLTGPAGCGKSTIAFRYALSAAQRNERAAIFTFDESVSTLVQRATGLGMDPAPFIENGLLELQQIDAAELSPGEFVSRIRKLVEKEDLRMLVIDSMNGLLNAMPNEQFLTMQLHELFTYLAHQGIATIVTLAQYGIIGTTMESPIDVSYLADSVLLFRYFEQGGALHQALSVVKKRSGPHERTIRELVFDKGKVYVGNPLTNFEGVLTGVPRLTGRAFNDEPNRAPAA